MERGRVLVGTVAAVVALQVLVPAFQLLSGDQERYGWQMYAGRVAVSGVEPLDSAGRPVAVPGWVARLRPEIDWEEHAPGMLCPRDESVETIRISYSDGTREDVGCS